MSKFILLLIIILCSVIPTFSQTMTEDKIFYSENYSYHYGDNLAWAKRDFDDSGWNTVALDSFPSEEWNGIGWFRMWIEIDTSLIRKPLGFSPKIIGSIDIFIDGRYQFSFGEVGMTIEEEEPLFVNTYLPPESFLT